MDNKKLSYNDIISLQLDHKATLGTQIKPIHQFSFNINCVFSNLKDEVWDLCPGISCLPGWLTTGATRRARGAFSRRASQGTLQAIRHLAGFLIPTLSSNDLAATVC